MSATDKAKPKMLMRAATIVAGAVAAGVGVLLAGNLPWIALLAPLNLRALTALPWAVVPMAAYLVLYWRFISGRVGPAGTRGWRRENLRANPVTGDVWGLALLTGLVGFVAVLSFVAVMARVVPVPPSSPLGIPPGMPAPTVFVLLLMSSLVAGVTEEAGFRGYMQTPLERRFGLAFAVLTNGVVFGLLHFPNHPEHVLPMLPYYIAVSALYGSITAATNSILPSLVLHATGDVWSLTRLWAFGTAEWQLDAQPPALIWNAGVDAGFLWGMFVLVTSAGATWWLCAQTASLARDEGLA